MNIETNKINIIFLDVIENCISFIQKNYFYMR